MRLSLSRPCLQTAVRPRPTRRTRAVRVSAWAGENSPFAGLLRMFLPQNLINTKEDWAGVSTTSFSGKVDRKRRPFKDGYASPSADQVLAQENQMEKANALGYLNDAVENVVGHNFKGDSTEPDWKNMSGNSIKGDLRRKHKDRDEKGFHSIKL